MKLIRVEDKLGIRASDTAAFSLEDCRVPKDTLLGDPEIKAKNGFAGVMQTFDNTRPLVAAMAIGVARAALDHTRERWPRPASRSTRTRPAYAQSAAAAELLDMEADFEAARLLTHAGRWMADNGQPNSLQASMAKAKAGRMGTDVRCAASRCAAPPASARPSCSRSGRATRRSSTSSRARSRSSC